MLVENRAGSATPLQRTEGSGNAVVIGGVASVDIAKSSMRKSGI